MLQTEEIKEKINILDLVGEYVQLKKAGANYRGLCPFHQEKTPSFMVSPQKQIWHCFGCGLGGDVFEFIKHSEAVEFAEALKILAQRTGVILTQQTVSYQKDQDQKKVLYEINDLAAKFYAQILDQSSIAAQARQYLQTRLLKPETIKSWQLGFAPDDFHTFENFIIKKGFQKREAVAAGLLVQKDDGRFFDRFRGRVMFPLFDIHGRTVGFTARILVDQDGVAKYLNSPETVIYYKSQIIFGLHVAKTAIRQKDQVIVVEGNMDVITCHSAGFGNVVASSGTALSNSQLETLKRFTSNIVFSFDVDAAGLRATRRAVELALHLGFEVKIASIPKALAKDPDELIRRDPNLWATAISEAKSFLDFYFESVFAKLTNVLTNSEKKQAVSEILPLLSLLPDPIDRAHYIQKLANKIDVSENLIIDLLNTRLRRNELQHPGIAVNRMAHTKLGRQELLERRVLGFLLKFRQELASEWAKMDPEDFSTPVLKKIFLDVAEASKDTEVDPKIRDEIEILVFAVENELSYLQDWKLDDLKKSFFGEFRQELLKKKLRQISSRLQTAEHVGRVHEAKSLIEEFNNLSRELSRQR